MEPHVSKAVFLSYAREDAAAAQRVTDALRAFGVEVWFDQNELRGGDAWDQKIRRQIKDCGLFLAIISSHTQERGEGYFRLEWNLAVERTHLMMEGVPFLVPVVVDETQESASMVPEAFMRVQWTRLPKGLPSPQFVDQVQRLLALPHKPAAPTATTEATSHAPVRVRRAKVPFWPLAAVGVVGFVVAAYVLMRPYERAPAATPMPVTGAKFVPAVPVVNEKSIAVLPFDNLSEDKDNNAFFADGIHEDILTNLAYIRELRVVSRTSVLGYRGKPENVRDIARKLGVTYVLEGSVRRAGGKVRVTAQLIHAATDEHVWAKDYMKDLTATDVFAIQSDLAEKIAASLQAVLSPQEKKLIAQHPTENAEAYDLYLKARANRRSSLSGVFGRLQQQENLLKNAVVLDPKFAAAWSELAIVHTEIYSTRERTAARLALAKQAIDNALQRAPESPEVVRANAEIYHRGYHDYARAAAQYDKLIQLQPNDSNGYSGLGFVQARQGKWAESLASLRKALQLDQGDLSAANSLRMLLSSCRRYGELKDVMRRLAELSPENPGLAFQLAYVSFLESGSTREVEDFFTKMKVTAPKARSVAALHRSWADAQGKFTEAVQFDLELIPSGEKSIKAAVRLAANGRLQEARLTLDELLTSLKREIADQPESESAWARLGQVEAIMGHPDEALQAARHATALVPEARDACVGPGLSSNLAFVYAWTGDKDRAVTEYARLLRVPSSGLNIHEMRRHPDFAPLRGDARFEALLNDSKNNAPLF